MEIYIQRPQTDVLTVHSLARRTAISDFRVLFQLFLFFVFQLHALKYVLQLTTHRDEVRLFYGHVHTLYQLGEYALFRTMELDPKVFQQRQQLLFGSELVKTLSILRVTLQILC